MPSLLKMLYSIARFGIVYYPGVRVYERKSGNFFGENYVSQP
jgi:hypothetical protein